MYSKKASCYYNYFHSANALKILVLRLVSCLPTQETCAQKLISKKKEAAWLATKEPNWCQLCKLRQQKQMGKNTVTDQSFLSQVRTQQRLSASIPKPYFKNHLLDANIFQMQYFKSQQLTKNIDAPTALLCLKSDYRLKETTIQDVRGASIGDEQVAAGKNTCSILHFLKQFKDHLLSNNVFLNRQFMYSEKANIASVFTWRSQPPSPLIYMRKKIHGQFMRII